jgi:hypothetical protein
MKILLRNKNFIASIIKKQTNLNNLTMKHLTKIWSMALLLTATMFMVSCGEDDEPVIVVGDGLAVSDGYYFVQTGNDPVAEKALLPEKVEGEAFAAVDRDGFFGNYVFLQAGDYQLQKVENREITSTIGGDLGAPELETDEGYLVAKTTQDGSAVNVETSGYYKVSFDETLSELIMMRVTTVSLIGAAVPNDSPDVELTVKEEASDEGFVFEGSGIEMRGGKFKIRINNRWVIDRRVERGDIPAGPTNGYVAFTNYGGSIDNLVAGGADMEIDAADAGLYTVEIKLTNDGGAEFTSSKTGDVEPITFDPNDYQFGLIGDATAGGWDTDQNMFYKQGDDGVDRWYQVVTFAETGAFLFITNDDFAFKIGGALSPDESTIVVGGGDIPTPGAGDYYVVISTADEGETWEATMTEAGWSLIGVGSPSGSWDVDTPLVADGSADGITTYSYTGAFTGGEFKFRAGADWAYNLGGDLSALSVDGGNFNYEAGTYEVILSYDGSVYSATVTAQ